MPKDYVRIVLEKAAGVIKDEKHLKKGEIYPMGWRERACWKRFYNDVMNPPADAEWYFDSDRANRWCKVAEMMIVPAGPHAGETFILMPWQMMIIAAIAGFKIKFTNPDGRVSVVPRFTQFYLEVARGNGKSTFAALLLVIAQILVKTEGGQFITAATKKDQAKIVFTLAKIIVDKMDDELKKEIGLSTVFDAVRHAFKNTEIKAVASESSTNEGLLPIMYILDELHAHPNHKMFQVLENAKGKHDFSIGISITTAGDNVHGICYEERQVVENILNESAFIDSYFGYIACLDDADNWDNEAAWYQANPSLTTNYTLLEAMRKSVAKIKSSGGANKNQFIIKRCNIWLAGHDRWLNLDEWDKLAVNELPDDKKAETQLANLMHRPCWIGVDLSDRDDISAIVYAWWADDAKTHLHIKTRHFLPRLVVQQRIREGKEYYNKWYKNGDIKLTSGDEGALVDYIKIKEYLQHALKTLNVHGVTFDQMSGAMLMAQELDREFPQSMVRLMPKTAKNVSDAALSVEARIRQSAETGNIFFSHDGNGVARWCASNAVVTRDTRGQILPKKPSEHSPLKIDTIDAMLHAITWPLIEPVEHNIIMVSSC